MTGPNGWEEAARFCEELAVDKRNRASNVRGADRWVYENEAELLDVLVAEFRSRVESPLVTESNRRFPIKGGMVRGPVGSVPWALLERERDKVEAQAQRNHGMTLDELAAAGGVTPLELWCLVRGRDRGAAVDPRVAELWLLGVTDLRTAYAARAYAIDKHNGGGT